MTALFHLLLLAADRQPAPCVVSGTIPGPDQTGVPIDVMPAAIFAGDCFCDMSIEVVRVLDDAVVSSQLVPQDDLQLLRWITLSPDDMFEANSEYVLRFVSTAPTCPGLEVPFATGDGRVIGIDGMPEVTAFNASYDDSSGAFAIEWTVQPAADPDHVSLLQLADANFQVSGHPYSFELVTDDGPIDGADSKGTGLPPGETCLRVRQVDGLAQATEWTDETCSAVPGGCSACNSASRQVKTPPFGPVAMALSSVIVVLRRRR